MQRGKKTPVGRSHRRHGVTPRNPHATSLNKAQYQKRIVPSKKKDVKPEIDYDREDI